MISHRTFAKETFSCHVRVLAALRVEWHRREGGRKGERERPCGTTVWEATSENLLVDLVNALASRAK